MSCILIKLNIQIFFKLDSVLKAVFLFFCFFCFFAEIICAELNSFPDGVITYDQLAVMGVNYPYGTVATHSCHSGHMLVGVSPNRTCTGDSTSPTGYFDGEQPYCQGACNS